MSILDSWPKEKFAPSPFMKIILFSRRHILCATSSIGYSRLVTTRLSSIFSPDTIVVFAWFACHVIGTISISTENKLYSIKFRIHCKSDNKPVAYEIWNVWIWIERMKPTSQSKRTIRGELRESKNSFSWRVDSQCKTEQTEQTL